jgi:hypothetical protein
VNNLFLVVIVAVFVVRAIVRMKSAAKRRPGPPARRDEPETERTRRVREEIARKIAARRDGPPRPLADRPAARPVPLPRAPSQPVAAFPEAAPAPLSDVELVLAEQRKLADEVRELEAQTPTARGFGFAPLAPPVPERAVIALPELADPEGARRAVLLREILGAPRGLSVEGCLWR